MPLIRWDDSYSVGIDEIDLQHKHLLDMTNELYDAMRQKKGKTVMSQILDRMIEYGNVHFATEERYFIKFFYSETEAHRNEHREFKKKVLELKARFEADEIGIAGELIDFLTTWLKTHIKGSDKKYSAFLKKKGII
ncbi:MAG: bacteriohemerythrin [Syntrophobacterales bacterium]|nr:bacteriohemerythrin [Syntrophobacterales bacterium]